MSQINPPFELSTIKIPSKTSGWNLDAWKYIPMSGVSEGPFPVIVMAHGLSANKKMGLAPYAEAFVNKGYACVVFDYRRFGDSDGEPRECVRTKEQLEDYRTVIAWVRQQKDFDGQRVVVWGTSYAGGHAVSLAAEKDLKLICAISQCPYVGSSPKPPAKALFKLFTYGIVDLLRQLIKLEPLYIPAVGKPGEVAGLTSPDSMLGFERLVRDKRDYPNRISASSLLELPFYKPSSKAPKISCPILLIISETDTLCPLEYSLRIVRSSNYVTEQRAPGGHFDLYHGGPDYDLSLNAQLEFLQQHVPVV